MSPRQARVAPRRGSGRLAGIQRRQVAFPTGGTQGSQQLEKSDRPGLLPGLIRPLALRSPTCLTSRRHQRLERVCICQKALVHQICQRPQQQESFIKARAMTWREVCRQLCGLPVSGVKPALVPCPSRLTHHASVLNRCCSSESSRPGNVAG